MGGGIFPPLIRRVKFLLISHAPWLSGYRPLLPPPNKNSEDLPLTRRLDVCQSIAESRVSTSSKLSRKKNVDKSWQLHKNKMRSSNFEILDISLIKMITFIKMISFSMYIWKIHIRKSFYGREASNMDLVRLLSWNSCEAWSAEAVLESFLSGISNLKVISGTENLLTRIGFLSKVEDTKEIYKMWNNLSWFFLSYLT